MTQIKRENTDPSNRITLIIQSAPAGPRSPGRSFPSLPSPPPFFFWGKKRKSEYGESRTEEPGLWLPSNKKKALLMWRCGFCPQYYPAPAGPVRAAQSKLPNEPGREAGPPPDPLGTDASDAASPAPVLQAQLTRPCRRRGGVEHIPECKFSPTGPFPSSLPPSPRKKAFLRGSPTGRGRRGGLPRLTLLDGLLSRWRRRGERDAALQRIGPRRRSKAPKEKGSRPEIRKDALPIPLVRVDVPLLSKKGPIQEGKDETTHTHTQRMPRTRSVLVAVLCGVTPATLPRISDFFCISVLCVGVCVRACWPGSHTDFWQGG